MNKTANVVIGPVMMDLESTVLTEEEQEIIRHPAVGGIIYFTRNYESPEQLTRLSEQIRSIRSDIIIAVDQEGGRVQRFRSSFSWLPPLRMFGEIYDKNKQSGLKYAHLFAQIMATELLCYGIDFSFSPVLDVDYKRSRVIGDRAFHTDVDSLISLADTYINGLSKAGMAAVGKHFPGHGYVAADSHVDMPVDPRTYEEIYENDLRPYQSLITKLAGIMPAHVIYSQVDELPAGYSSFWLKKILRDELQFSGAIFSDDLNMDGAGAIGASYIDRANNALYAGCDMILICNNRPAALEIITNIDKKLMHTKIDRINKIRAKKKYDIATVKSSPAWKQVQQFIEKYS